MEQSRGELSASVTAFRVERDDVPTCEPARLQLTGQECYPRLPAAAANGNFSLDCLGEGRLHDVRESRNSGSPGVVLRRVSGDDLATIDDAWR